MSISCFILKFVFLMSVLPVLLPVFLWSCLWLPVVTLRYFTRHSFPSVFKPRPIVSSLTDFLSYPMCKLSQWFFLFHINFDHFPCHIRCTAYPVLNDCLYDPVWNLDQGKCLLNWTVLRQLSPYCFWVHSPNSLHWQEQCQAPCRTVLKNTVLY